MKQTNDKKQGKEDAELAWIRAEFDRVMNTPSPNPRYHGLTPTGVIRCTVKPKPETKEKPPA